MTGAQRPAAVCARCGMAINYMLKTNGRADEPGFVWVHGGPADHDPVLAPSAEPPRLYNQPRLAGEGRGGNARQAG